MELTEFSIGLLIAAFASGAITGWCLRQPHTITAAPPDLEREKTIAEAHRQSLMDDIAEHLSETEKQLVSLTERQVKLAAQLRGESPTNAIVEPNEPDLTLPPKDYSDSRGQLQ